MHVTTRSEAIQRVLSKENCECLFGCDVSVTKNFFARICNSTSYPNCHHFARKMGELKAPIDWLQKMAVQKSKQDSTIEGASISQIDLRK
ncbi:MAG: hypothetical protein JSV27_01065 [Candidatus Bathyarchaeota archaeon]|nr:MAG: hypothetical protein JSV27_01065 [Candidatus Bathyarchaeota archaeon]